MKNPPFGHCFGFGGLIVGSVGRSLCFGVPLSDSLLDTVAGDDQKSPVPEPGEAEQVVPENPHEEEQEHRHPDGLAETKYEIVALFRERVRRFRRTAAQIDPETHDNRDERTPAKRPGFAQELAESGCATRSPDRSQAARHPGPIPFSGFA
jgi:hypothetical protein